ncbi:hypothetical protein F4818DRAFT_443105 [Hypoxylon cercidicola]|nr:hypothetical protein F4818DRAFT_443105 [Hypoxylon cercidicola]
MARLKKHDTKNTSTKNARLKRRRGNFTSRSKEGSEDSSWRPTNSLSPFNSPGPPNSPLSKTPRNGNGLDWDWVITLDQDPEGKSYFPPRYNSFGASFFLGDDDERPSVSGESDLPDLTTWMLAKIRQSRRSSVIAQMMRDESLQVKWVVCPRTHWKNNGCFYREINIYRGTANDEGTFSSAPFTMAFR